MDTSCRFTKYGVGMIGGVNYEMIDDEGNLHITVKSKKKGK